jgi:hypothetical protein
MKNNIIKKIYLKYKNKYLLFKKGGSSFDKDLQKAIEESRIQHEISEV